MARHITAGIDIGTSQVKVVIAEQDDASRRPLPRILGTGVAESRGLRHGYIVNSGEVTQSIIQAVAAAEKTAGTKVRRAFVSVGGVGLSGVVSQGATVVSRGDSEITELDMDKVQDAARSEIPTPLIVNRKVIYEIPILYRIDNRPVLGGRPLGMKGVRLEARIHFVTCLEQHLADLIRSVEEAGIEVEDVVAAPIAASVVTLTKTQKIAGCVLANLGSETVSIVVYENNLPISLEVFPLGSTDITNDIALGLKIPLEEAEQIKLGAVTSTPVPRRRLEEIVNARLSDVFDLIEAHLKKIGRSGLLPAGIVVTGGGAGLPGIEEHAKAALKLPSKLGTITIPDQKGVIKDTTWSVAYGLCIIGLLEDNTGSSPIRLPSKGAFTKLWNWLKQFLP